MLWPEDPLQALAEAWNVAGDDGRARTRHWERSNQPQVPDREGRVDPVYSAIRFIPFDQNLRLSAAGLGMT